MASRYSFRIMLRPEPEGGYTVMVPSLPGIYIHGEGEYTESGESKRVAVC